MSTPHSIRRSLHNARFYFIPEGTVVGGVTVSATTWPTASPITNWTDFEIPEVERVVPRNVEEEEEFRIPRDTGGYLIDRNVDVVSRIWGIFTHKASSYTKRLEHGTAVFPTVNVATIPGAVSNPFIRGVALFELQGKGGTMEERFQLWGKLRLVSPGEVGPKTRLIEMNFELLNSGNNTLVLL